MEKRSTFSSVLENLANIAIAVAAVCLIYFVFTSRHNRQAMTQNAPIAPRVGDRVPLDLPPGKVMLIALQEGCHFCKESMPFYKKLVSDFRSTKGAMHLVFALPTSTGKEYLKQNGIDTADVRGVPLNQLEVGGTPTIIMLDAQHKISSFWVGKLPETKQNEVENVLLN